MTGHTIILAGPSQRKMAREYIDKAPQGYVVNIREPKRNLDQNARFWSTLTDISRAKPEGRMHTPETWKMLFMHALGYETRFEMGLDGRPFPVGFRSSQLSVREMADLITFIQEYGDRHGVKWSEPNPYEEA